MCVVYCWSFVSLAIRFYYKGFDDIIDDIEASVHITPNIMLWYFQLDQIKLVVIIIYCVSVASPQRTGISVSSC